MTYRSDEEARRLLLARLHERATLADELEKKLAVAEKENSALRKRVSELQSRNANLHRSITDHQQPNKYSQSVASLWVLEAEEQDPQQRVDLLLKIGHLCERKLDDREASERAYRAVLELDPENARALAGLKQR